MKEPNQTPTLAERLDNSAAGSDLYMTPGCAVCRDAKVEIDRLTAALSAARQQISIQQGESDSDLANIGKLLAQLKAAEAERDSLRGQLEQVREIVTAADAWSRCDYINYASVTDLDLAFALKQALERYAARKRSEEVTEES